MTILQTERLLLRPLAMTDMAAFRIFAADGELTKYMLFYPLEPETEIYTFLQNAVQAWNSLFPQTYEFAVLRKAELLGTVTLEYMTPEQGMLGWLFRADAHPIAHWLPAAMHGTPPRNGRCNALACTFRKLAAAHIPRPEKRQKNEHTS